METLDTKSTIDTNQQAAPIVKSHYKHKASPCPMKEALQFLAGAWTLEIYWHLRQGPLRFGQLKNALQTVSPKVLTQRLRDLEDLGVVDRNVIESYPPQVEYSLAEFGKKFLPILDQIAEVGSNIIRKSKTKSDQNNLL